MVTETLLPMLRDAAGLRVTVHETRHRGDATGILGSMDLVDVDMVVYVGGDGTVYEGLQVRGRLGVTGLCTRGCR